MNKYTADAEKRRERILVYIADYVVANDYAPTLEIIAPQVGLKSKGPVWLHICALEAAGLLRLPRNQHGKYLPHTMNLTDAGWKRVQELRPGPSYAHLNRP